MDSFDLTKPLGVLRKTVVLEALNDYECNHGYIFMRVKTEKAEVHPLAIRAAEKLLRRASPEERKRLQQEINVYSLASDFKVPLKRQPPVLGTIWILGARRELHSGLGRRFAELSARLPHKLNRGDYYDLTIETSTFVHLSCSHSIKESKDILRWQDLGDVFHVGERIADPSLSKEDSVAEDLVYGQILSVPEHNDPQYAIRVIRDYRRRLSINFTFELAHRPPSAEEYSAFALSRNNKRYGTGVNQNVTTAFLHAFLGQR